MLFSFLKDVPWELIVIVYGALMTLAEVRFRRIFATEKDLQGVSGRADAMQTLYLQLREASEKHERELAELRIGQQRQWQDIAERVIAPLDRISERTNDMAEQQAAITTTLEHVCDWLKQANIPSPAPRPPRRS